MENRLIYPALCTLLLVSCSKDELEVSGNESVNKRFQQSIEWNATHPYREIVVPTDTYLIWSMSDIHVGGTVNLDRFNQLSRDSNASAVVIVGDLTNGHASDYDTLMKHLPEIPYFCIVGNHDLHYGGWVEYYNRIGSSTYLFSVSTPVARDLFICLDTGGGTIGDQQLRWLEDLLEENREAYRNCTILTHNNFFRLWHTESTNPLPDELHTLIELFTIYQVNLVVTGHNHYRETVILGNTPYLVMDALKDGISNAGYLKISVAEGLIDYQFEAL